jgi:predicted nucleic acid-binding Zn finger protein
MIQQLSGSSGWVNRWEVASHTSDREYVVAQRPDGSWGCSCPAWKFKKPVDGVRADCKHIQEVKGSEPVDMTKTSAKAAEAFKRSRAENKPITVAVASEPVFLLQTTRRIILRD